MMLHRSILIVLGLALAACGNTQKDTPVKETITAKNDPPVVELPADSAASDAPEQPTEPEDEFSAYDPRVAQAARVAIEIQDDPTQADAVLASSELDREKLDALMFEIASDPELTQQYRIARGMAAEPPSDAEVPEGSPEEGAPEEGEPAHDEDEAPED